MCLRLRVHAYSSSGPSNLAPANSNSRVACSSLACSSAARSLPSVGVSYGAHEHAAFEALSPLFVAHTTRELHDWLAAHG